MLKFLQEIAKMQKPEADLRGGIIRQVEAAAASSGLKTGPHPLGVLVGNGEKCVVAVQFGGRREFYETMETLEKESVDCRAVITSSKVKSMKIGEMKWLLNNKYQTKNKWLIIDIEHAESPKTVNFMLYSEAGGEEVRHHYAEKPKRKKIYGRRGEHKEQD